MTDEAKKLLENYRQLVGFVIRKHGFDPNDDDEMGDDGATGPDGTLDGQNDWDDDGYSNEQEEAGGTDPRDAESVPVPVAGVFTLLVLALALCVIALRGRRKEIV